MARRGKKKRKKSYRLRKRGVIWLALLLALSAVFVLVRTLPKGGLTADVPQAQSGWWLVRFTGTDGRNEWTARAYEDNPDRLVVSLVQSAESSIALACYQFDLPGLVQGLLDAKERGVAVRVVTDGSSLDWWSARKLAQAGIEVRARKGGGIMHDKFLVVDDSLLVTGTMNFTETEAFRNNNALLLFNSSHLAQAYAAEFNEMWGGAFGPRSPDAPPVRLKMGTALFTLAFSPDTDFESLILDALRGARDSVRFLAFSFTSDPVGDAMAALSLKGVDVKGVFDEGQLSEYSEYEKLLRAGADVRPDGNRWKMHEKVMVIDGRTVVVGSYNFTASAKERNDENGLIVTDSAFAAPFTEEFWRVWGQATRALP